MMHAGDATFLRRVNQSAVLELIREQGPISRSEIARRLRLSPATITRIVNDLLENGIHRAGREPGSFPIRAPSGSP